MKRQRFGPVDAAYAVADYLPADPVVWLSIAALAGMRVSVDDGRLLITWGDIADPNQITFLNSWLSLTPGGHGAVIALLKHRQ